MTNPELGTLCQDYESFVLVVMSAAWPNLAIG